MTRASRCRRSGVPRWSERSDTHVVSRSDASTERTTQVALMLSRDCATTQRRQMSNYLHSLPSPALGGQLERYVVKLATLARALARAKISHVKPACISLACSCAVSVWYVRPIQSVGILRKFCVGHDRPASAVRSADQIELKFKGKSIGLRLSVYLVRDRLHRPVLHGRRMTARDSTKHAATAEPGGHRRAFLPTC